MPPQIEFCDVDRIFADLGPVPWMCQGLKLAPGAPTIVAGASFSGKTAMMQSVALGVATGTPVPLR